MAGGSWTFTVAVSVAFPKAGVSSTFPVVGYV